MMTDLEFEAVWRQHRPMVLAEAAHVTGNPWIAEDIAQVVFTQLWAGKVPPGQERAWLRTLTRSRAVDHIRHDMASRTVDTRYTHNTAPLAPDLIADREVQLLIDSLDPSARRLFRLAFLDGLSYRNIAAVVGEPEGTIKSRIRRTLSQLRAAS